MTATSKQSELVTCTPRLSAADDVANYWMRQATLRLRREVCWCWSERGAAAPPQGTAALPPFTDRASVALDLSRFWEEKQRFYLTDVTARYLTEQLDAPPPRAAGEPARGSFAWVVAELELDDAASFILALALTTAFDASMGSVVAACLNDQARTHPSLALAQKLWDAPADVLALSDPAHPLFARGIVRRGRADAHRHAETDWEAPLTVPSVVARQLLFPDAPLPHGLAPLDAAEVIDARTDSARLAARRATAAAVARAAGRAVVASATDAARPEDAHHLDSLATLCWLRDLYLFL